MIYVLVLALVVITFLARSLDRADARQPIALFVLDACGSDSPASSGASDRVCLRLFSAWSLHLYSTGEYANLTNVDSPLFAAELSRAVTFVMLGFGIAWVGERLLRVPCTWRMTARVPRWLARLMSSRSSTPFRTPWW